MVDYKKLSIIFCYHHTSSTHMLVTLQRTFVHMLCILLPTDEGNCSCNGTCSCNEGYVGFTCSCPTSNSSCINGNDTALCSNQGECRCGVCVCQNYTIRSGAQCQLCPVSCSMLLWLHPAVFSCCPLPLSHLTIPTGYVIEGLRG